MSLESPEITGQRYDLAAVNLAKLTANAETPSPLEDWDHMLRAAAVQAKLGDPIDVNPYGTAESTGQVPITPDKPGNIQAVNGVLGDLGIHARERSGRVNRLQINPSTGFIDLGTDLPTVQLADYQKGSSFPESSFIVANYDLPVFVVARTEFGQQLEVQGTFSHNRSQLTDSICLQRIFSPQTPAPTS